MDIRALRYFICIADCHGITAAAQKLHMTQPPLTNQLKALEEELGFPLFYRINKKFYLTEKGTYLYQRAKLLVEDFEGIMDSFTDMRNGITGTLNIGTITSTGILVLPALVRSFFATNPGIRVQLWENDSSTLFERLRDNKIDAAFVKVRQELPGMEYVYLDNRGAQSPKSEMYVVGRKDILHVDSEETFLYDIANIPIIIHDAQRTPFLEFCHLQNIRPHIMGTNAHTVTSLTWCIDGLGIALLSKRSMALIDLFEEKGSLTFKHLAGYDGIHVRDALAYRSENAKNPILKRFIEETKLFCIHSDAL